MSVGFSAQELARILAEDDAPRTTSVAALSAPGAYRVKDRRGAPAQPGNPFQAKSSTASPTPAVTLATVPVDAQMVCSPTPATTATATTSVSITATDTAPRVPDRSSQSELCVGHTVHIAAAVPLPLDLGEVERRRKDAETANARRRQALSQQLAARRSKTQHETLTLRAVELELANLDSILANDVSIIRSRIEDAVRLHSEAQRRFEAAEAEFVAAKLDVHRKRDLKEQLTEHLLLVIQENEARKSRKLDELMQRIAMSAAEADALVAQQTELEARLRVEAAMAAERATQAQARSRPNMRPDTLPDTLPDMRQEGEDTHRATLPEQCLEMI